MEEFNTGLDFNIDDIHKGLADERMFEEAKTKAKYDKITKTKEKVEKQPALTQEDLSELLGAPNVTKPVKAKKAASAKTVKAEKATEERDSSKLVDPDKNMSQKKQDELHQNLLMVAQRFLNNDRYKDYLKTHGFKATDKIEKKTLKDLESYVNRMRYCASNKKGNQIANDSIAGIFKMLETGITNNSKGRINLNGFAAALFSNEDFLDDLELFKIEYLSFVNVRYELRLVLTMVQTAFLVHSVNTKPMFQMRMKAAAQPVQPANQSTTREDNLHVEESKVKLDDIPAEPLSQPEPISPVRVVKKAPNVKKPVVKKAPNVKVSSKDQQSQPEPSSQPIKIVSGDGFPSSDDLDKLFD